MCIVPGSSLLVNPEGLEGGVYLLRVGPRKFYFGVASNFKRRLSEHLRRLRRGAHDNVILQRSYDKHKCVQFEPVAWCDRAASAIIEAILIRCHLADQNCANLRIEDGTTHTAGAETRRRLSELAKNRSCEHRRKLGAGRRGKEASEETKRKIRESRLGKKRSAESVRKTAEANRGKVRSAEARANIRKAAIKRESAGPRSPGHRRKLSEAQLGKRHSDETRRKISEANQNASEEVVRVAIALAAGGMSFTKAAKRVGKSTNWLSRIIRGKTYKHLNLPGRRERLA